MDNNKLRVGDPDAPVLAGEYSPSGDLYHPGQFAPTLEDLSLESLLQADKAALLNKELLPIYDDEGEIDEDKLNSWFPRLEGIVFSDKLPKYALAVLVDVLHNLYGLRTGINFKYVLFGDRDTQESLTSLGETIVSADHTFRNKQFEASLRIYPSFYKYVATPLMGEIPGYRSGLSVAAYSVYHALGHLLFARMLFDGKLKNISRFMGISWTKYSQAGTEPGMFMDTRNMSAWERLEGSTFPTEAARYSYEDDFAETFALFMTNNKYLLEVSPERHEVMGEILKDYGYVL